LWNDGAGNEPDAGTLHKSFTILGPTTLTN
jgi:hypothetical protein